MSEGTEGRTEIGGVSPQGATQYKPEKPLSQPTIDDSPNPSSRPAWRAGLARKVSIDQKREKKRDDGVAERMRRQMPSEQERRKLRRRRRRHGLG